MNDRTLLKSTAPGAFSVTALLVLTAFSTVILAIALSVIYRSLVTLILAIVLAKTGKS